MLFVKPKNNRNCWIFNFSVCVSVFLEVKSRFRFWLKHRLTEFSVSVNRNTPSYSILEILWELCSYWDESACAGGASEKLLAAALADHSVVLWVVSDDRDAVCLGIFSLNRAPLHALLFVGGQLIALSRGGHVGIWHGVTQNWQVRVAPMSSDALFPSLAIPRCKTCCPSPATTRPARSCCSAAPTAPFTILVSVSPWPGCCDNVECFRHAKVSPSNERQRFAGDRTVPRSVGRADHFYQRVPDAEIKYLFHGLLMPRGCTKEFDWHFSKFRSVRQLDRNRIWDQLGHCACHCAASGNGRPWPTAVSDVFRAQGSYNQGHADNEPPNIRCVLRKRFFYESWIGFVHPYRAIIDHEHGDTKLRVRGWGTG